MKKKLLSYGTAAILIVLVLLSVDRFKLYKEEKPPLPVVTVEGKEIPSVLGAYNWHGTKYTFKDPIYQMAGRSGPEGSAICLLPRQSAAAKYHHQPNKFCSRRRKNG